MTHSFQFLIEQPEAGQRLDEFFASRFGTLSRMRIANMIDAGVCQVNGAAGRAGYRILAGDAVHISFDDGGPTAMSPEPIPLEVIHEDEDLILIVKPAGMLVHPTMSVKSGTLANALAYYLNRSWIENGGSRIDDPANASSEIVPPSSILNHQHVIRPGLVHRLDRATSGLMVVAKTPRALSVLSRHFRKRLVEKRYLALVHGNVKPVSGTIVAPIGRDPDQRPRWRVMDTGKPAETRFTVIERPGRATLLELEPVTGRTNQLRIHCAHIGHPIVGDEMHRDLVRIADCEFEKAQSQSAGRQATIRDSQSGIPLCLHAWKLAFHHPSGGEWVEFSSPLPAEIAKVIDSYREG